MSGPVRVRFAPSPPGHLHIGGAGTALFNWLFARHHGGKFVLRIVDTEMKPKNAETNARIFEGLEMAGLDLEERAPPGGGVGAHLENESTESYAPEVKKHTD